jgi:methylenetetrahydrofolate reductase (NADPH)
LTGFQHLGFEVIPFKKTREAVLAHVPREVPLTITASPGKGQDATIDLAVELTGDGYSVSPHLSAQQVRDPKIIARWARQLTRRGIDLPVYVGVPGAVTRQKLLRVSGGPCRSSAPPSSPAPDAP